MEIVPSEFTDVVREPIQHISEGGRSIDDAIGYETLHDAVIDAENVSASLLGHVEPENLLFIFGQTMQSLGYAPIELPMTPPPSNECEYVDRNRNSEEDGRDNKSKPKSRTIVLGKLKNANALEDLIVNEKQEGGYDPKCYEITWRKL